jgi:hypothetical protein
MKCPQCEYDDEGTREGLHHQKSCPRQSQGERIKELEEALVLARHEINRVLDNQLGSRR